MKFDKSPTELLYPSNVQIDKMNLVDAFKFMLNDQSKVISIVDSSMQDIIKVIDDIEDPSYPTTVESEDSNHVFVGRLRNDINHKNSLNLWVVSNNLRKGAAYNSVQIAELLVKKKLKNLISSQLLNQS